MEHKRLITALTAFIIIDIFWIAFGSYLIHTRETCETKLRTLQDIHTRETNLHILQNQTTINNTEWILVKPNMCNSYFTEYLSDTLMAYVCVQGQHIFMDIREITNNNLTFKGLQLSKKEWVKLLRWSTRASAFWRQSQARISNITNTD